MFLGSNRVEVLLLVFASPSGSAGSAGSASSVGLESFSSFEDENFLELCGDSDLKRFALRLTVGSSSSSSGSLMTDCLCLSHCRGQTCWRSEVTISALMFLSNCETRSDQNLTASPHVVVMHLNQRVSMATCRLVTR